MRPLFSMRRALEDSRLLGDVLAGDSWAAWRTLLIAIMGEALTAEERVTFTALTGREREPDRPVEEFWGIIGRRGGKSRAMAALSAYLGALCEHPNLSPGERGVIPMLAVSKRQANVMFTYTSAIFARPPFDKLKTRESLNNISLSNGVEVLTMPASNRSIRGVTALAVICDEIAYWFSEEDSRNPDTEILNAVRPALATTGGPLIAISSPHARRGEMWEAYRRHYGPTGDASILVAQGASRVLNPSLTQRVVDRAYDRDPARAAAEYGAVFRSDVESLVPSEVVDACIERGVYERPPASRTHYQAFTDPSGGSADSFTLAIAHREDNVAVLDAVRERKPPFSPDDVCREYAELLKSYVVSTVVGDRYAGEWPRERFLTYGITYKPAERTKSEIYLATLPLLNSRRADLLDVPRLEAQLIGLERRTARGGRDSIDHGPGAHDDVANAVGGVLVQVAVPARSIIDLADDDPIDGPRGRSGFPRLRGRLFASSFIAGCSPFNVRSASTSRRRDHHSSFFSCERSSDDALPPYPPT